jgi:uncharacterized phage protein (TIGR01671 family)
MSREFKFRIYSFISKSFIYFDIYEYPQGIAGGVSEPQQYTGSKDKNNNPIYEGDIIKEHHFEDWGDKIGYEYIGIVIYKAYSDDILFAGYKTIPAKNQNTKFGGNAMQSDCEVIGNIFEHKHLLKK